MSMDPARPYTMESSWPARLVGPLEEQTWLDKVGDQVMRLLDPLLKHERAPLVMDFLHGRWLGHALHPVLSDLPIGFWTASLLLDAFGASTSAGLVNAAGSAAAVATAASGVADWTATDGRERRLGLLHGLLNVAGLSLQLMSLGARIRFDRGAAVRLSAAGWTVSTLAAYLGGELVFGRGQMVSHDAWTAGPAVWTPVLPAAELADGQARGVEVAGRTVLVYREAGRVHAMEDACSHAGGPLHEGEIRDGLVTCPWHGSRFRLSDGSVRRGPATFPQLRLQARERAGQIEVRGRKG